MMSSLEYQARMYGWRPGRVMAMLTGFFDESGEAGSGGRLKRLTMGGFFAPWSAVEALCVQWRAALACESLSSFHMKDIASDEHAYAAWTAERQERLNRFVDLLVECGVYFCAFSYPVVKPDAAFKDAYETALARVMIVAASLAEQSGEQVDIVFAQTHEIKQELVGRYFDRLEWGRWLDGWQVKKSATNPPLQASEIVARGMKRVMQDGLVTHSFGRVLTAGKPLRFWPEDTHLGLLLHG